MATPPKVVSDFDENPSCSFGPLSAHLTRPLERATIGDTSVPIAVNTYTGGPPEWTGWFMYQLTQSIDAVRVLHVFLGGLLITLVHRFLTIHGTPIAAGVAGIVLATDWSMHFYRKVLGGTEVLLLSLIHI